MKKYFHLEPKSVTVNDIIFNETELPQILDIGDSANNVVYILHKYLNNYKIEQNDIKILERFKKILDDGEKGKKIVKELRFNGSESKNISLYGILLKLFSIIPLDFELKKDEIGNMIPELKNMINELITIIKTNKASKEINKRDEFFEKLMTFLSNLVESIKELNYKLTI